MSIAPDLTRAQRAEGMLTVHLLGDALGSGYEFSRGLAPTEPVTLRKGVFGHPAGTGTDDTAVMRACARAVLDPDPDEGFQATYVRNLIDWKASGPLDIGGQTSKGIQAWKATGKAPATDREAQGNGALMGSAPLAFLGSDLGQAAAMLQTMTTHPSPEAAQVTRRYVATLAAILADGAYDDGALPLIPRAGWDSAPIGWCKLAYDIARDALDSTVSIDAVSPMEALRSVVRRGGDTDTNAAIAGALLGCYWGPEPFDFTGIDPAELATNKALASKLAAL